MDNTALRYFLEVARSGSLSKASERLFVAVSALSRQIGKLEEELGTPLFERRPRGMVLSDAGRMLADYARRSLLETERVVGEIRGLAEEGRATIRVASSEGVAPHFLPQVFAHFLKTHPSTHFQLDVSAPSVATQRVFEPVFVSNYHAALQSFVRHTDAVTLTGYLTVRSRLDVDGLAAVPITNAELHQRTLQVQTMAGRTLPHTMQAFLELLMQAIEEPEVVD